MSRKRAKKAAAKGPKAAERASAQEASEIQALQTKRAEAKEEVDRALSRGPAAVVAPSLTKSIAEQEDAEHGLRAIRRRQVERNADDHDEETGRIKKLREDEKSRAPETAPAYVDNPTDETFEIEVAASTYYVRPGENEIVSRTPSTAPDRAVAEYIAGKLAFRGVTFRSGAVGGGPKKAAKEGVEAELEAATVNMPTGGALKVPEVYTEETKFASDPPADERAQPERFQASGPMDPDGKLARERKRKMVESHITGKKPADVKQ